MKLRNLVYILFVIACCHQSAALADIHLYGKPVTYAENATMVPSNSLTPHTASPGIQDVPYFSGTNCTYTMGGYETNPSNPIMSATITISGKVRGWLGSQSSEDTIIAQHSGSVVSWSQKFRFDSTHFIDGTKVRLTITLVDSTSASYSGWVEATVFNRGYILNNRTFGFLQDNGVIAKCLTDANYHCLTANAHRASAIYNNMHKYTVFYIGTHGNDTFFGDSYNDGGAGYGLAYTGQSLPAIGDFSVPGAVGLKTSAEAPYSFAWVNACLSAANSVPSVGQNSAPDIDRGTYFYGPDTTDRCYFGWVNWSAITFFPSWTHSVWHLLGTGETIFSAAKIAFVESHDLGPVGPLDDNGDININLILQQPIVPKIIGDSKMRLHGVYLGPKSTDTFFILLP